MNEHTSYVEVWKSLHPRLWSRYAGSAENERMLLEGTERFRPCLTAAERSFHENRGSFTRTDGKSEADDHREAEQRKALREAELEQNVTVTEGDFRYAASLSPAQLAEAYASSPEFARKYRRLIREFGFQAVPKFARKGGI
jgi:hypothetical protein